MHENDSTTALPLSLTALLPLQHLRAGPAVVQVGLGDAEPAEALLRHVGRRPRPVAQDEGQVHGRENN